MNNTLSTVRQLKEQAEDFEWYPTTNEILDVISEDLQSIRYSHRRVESLLDIGAGNGKALYYISNKVENIRSVYAIEKSQRHRASLDQNTWIVGVDFHKTSLLDKDYGAIFCNPPYSEYVQWTEKILSEVDSGTILYLVIPSRWDKQASIQSIIQDRQAKVETLGEFSFENAERAARANVSVLKITFANRYSRDEKTFDPFEKFFDSQFKYPEPSPEPSFEEQVKSHQMVQGGNLIETLCSLYQDRLQELHKNFQAICDIEHGILQEFDLTKGNLIKTVQEKIGGLRKQYWKRLFDALSQINTKLTNDTRRKLVERINRNTGIEFNEENIMAILEWVIKNTNTYLDAQFTKVYESMFDFSNIEKYKSNQKVFQKHGFNYNWHGHDYGKLRLKVGHRIVTSGFSGSSWGDPSELSESAANYIGDLMVIANNLGFTLASEPPRANDWKGSEAVQFFFKRDGIETVLFDVRFFQNGNMHFRFHKPFVQAMNIEYGRLKGWLRNEQEASDELDIDPMTVKKHFNSYFRMEKKGLLLEG